MREAITVIGGGLAGCEAAWQIARRGEKVRLYEMRPVRQTPAHRTDRLAEIVCSNSLKSDQPYNASWLLKEELRRLGSILIRIADSVRVPSGSALAVDRERFATRVTEVISSEPNIRLIREEIPGIPDNGIVIIANGPLDRAQYDAFYDALISAESVAIHEFEKACYFESCLPIEELGRRGRDTLRFGPMRPVGLDDPRTGRMPHAVVQLRQEDLMQSSYNIVGFQNHLKFSEQKRIFRIIPGLENAEFLRLGQIHRNTYINAPQTLLPTLAAKRDPRVFFAGQLAGTEGYIENVASGLVAGINAVRTARGQEQMILPAETAVGALCRYVSMPQKHFAPMNINFGLFPEIDVPRRTSRIEKQRLLCERALELCRPASTSTV